MRNPPAFPARRPSAFALPLVLWSLAFIAGLVVLVGGSVSDWVESEARAERMFRARQMALSGVALGMNPEVKAGNPLLKSGARDTEGFEVKISDEAGRVDPNFWIAQNNRAIFQQLFASWGIEREPADAAIDGLTDWIDGDDFRSMAGAEKAEYEERGREGFPANRPLLSVKEMEAVLGLDSLLASRSDWQSFFTIRHRGKINVQFAGEPVLAALARLTPRQCQALLELRAGQDAIDGSEDDLEFESIESVATLVGADGVQRQALVDFFDVSGSVRRIESAGYCGGTRHEIVVLFTSEAGSRILAWEER
jgi:hypothetical protein